jgi:hypothetical protein
MKIKYPKHIKLQITNIIGYKIYLPPIIVVVVKNICFYIFISAIWKLLVAKS